LIIFFDLIKNDTDLSIESLSQYEELQPFHGLNTANKVFKESWKPLVENLAKPTEYLLMSGGDLRLNIDEIDLLNKYGLSTISRPDVYLCLINWDKCF
jgi:hypothetical protein